MQVDTNCYNDTGENMMHIILLLLTVCLSLTGCYTMIDPPPEAYYDAYEDTVYVEGDPVNGVSVTVINNNEIILDDYYNDMRYLRQYRWHDNYYWDPYYYDYRYYNNRHHWHSGGYHRGGAVARPKKLRREEPLRRPHPSGDPGSSPSGGGNPAADSDQQTRRTGDSGDRPNAAPADDRSGNGNIKANQSDDKPAEVKEKPKRTARRISAESPKKSEQTKPPAEEKKSSPDATRKPAEKE